MKFFLELKGPAVTYSKIQNRLNTQNNLGEKPLLTCQKSGTLIVDSLYIMPVINIFLK